MGHVSASPPDEREPWERQTGETAKAYRAFSIYRDQGSDRSLASVAQELGVSKQHIESWSRQNGWVERVTAWDSIPAKAMAEGYADMVRDITDQHRALADKLVKRLSDNLDRMPAGADPAIKWSQAHNAATKSHAIALDYLKPKDDESKDEVAKAIEVLIRKLAED